MRWGTLVLLFSQVVWAAPGGFDIGEFVHEVAFGDVGGNGGDVVVCTAEDGKKTYELLDYFEAVRRDPPQVPELGVGAGPEERAAYAIERLSRYDQGRQKFYREQAIGFLGRVDWITSGPELQDIKDTGDIQIPDNCTVKQLAIRRPPFHPTVNPYLIDKRLFLELDDDHKAGLILHEIIYGEMIGLGQRNSQRARMFNGLLSSGLAVAEGEQGYFTIVEELFKVFYPPQFKQSKVEMEMRVGEVANVDLNTWLVHTPSGKLEWYALPGAPAWLTMEVSGLLQIQPTEPGEFKVSIVVKQDDTGAIAELKLKIS